MYEEKKFNICCTQFKTSPLKYIVSQYQHGNQIEYLQEVWDFTIFFLFFLLLIPFFAFNKIEIILTRSNKCS